MQDASEAHAVCSGGRSSRGMLEEDAFTYCSSGNWLGHAKHISPPNGRLSIMYASGRHPAANVLLLPRRSVRVSIPSPPLPSTRHPHSSPVKIDVRYPSLSYRPCCRLRRLFEREETPDTINRGHGPTAVASVEVFFFSSMRTLCIAIRIDERYFEPPAVAISFMMKRCYL